MNTTLLAVPNFSEGRDRRSIEAIGAAFGTPVLDIHSDADHHRTVFTVAAPPGRLAGAVVQGAERALDVIDVTGHDGAHPRVGAIDVAPIVYLADEDRGAATAEALVLADMLGERLDLPVFLYGDLADGRTRAELRRGGPTALAKRIQDRIQRPDFGPDRLHPTAGAVLVTARRPLVAFNVELAPPATLDDARKIAALLREGGGEGLESVRAIGIWLTQRGVAQVSINVEDHRRTPLAVVVKAVRRHAPVDRAELVGLAPKAAFDGFPPDVPVDNKRLIEDTLAELHGTGQCSAP